VESRGQGGVGAGRGGVENGRRSKRAAYSLKKRNTLIEQWRTIPGEGGAVVLVGLVLKIHSKAERGVEEPGGASRFRAWGGEKTKKKNQLRHQQLGGIKPITCAPLKGAGGKSHVDRVRGNGHWWGRGKADHRGGKKLDGGRDLVLKLSALVAIGERVGLVRRTWHGLREKN